MAGRDRQRGIASRFLVAFPCRNVGLVIGVLLGPALAMLIAGRALADDQASPLASRRSPVPATSRATRRPGSARRWTVARDGRGDVRSIGEAIDRARAGDVISVHPGVYHESLVLKQPLEIAGAGPRERVVIQSADADCIMVNADRAVIRGLTLRCRAGEDAKFFAVDAAQGEVVIDDCNLSSNALACVGVHEPRVTATVRNCWLHDSNDAGIFVYEGAHAVIEGCDIFDNADAGVAVQTKASAQLRRCRIHHNSTDGIAVTKLGEATLDSCDIFANAGQPIHHDKTSRAEVKNCRMPDRQLMAESIASNIDDADQNVDPDLKQLVLRFSEPMDTGAWHLGKAKKKYGRFPELRGDRPARFRDAQTFVIDVRLEPDTWYAINLNEPGHMDFQSAEGVPLEETVFFFQTAEAPDSTPSEELTDFDVGMCVLTFLQRPTQQNFTRARQAVIASKAYQSAKGNELDEIVTLYRAKKFEETKLAIEKYLPQLYLSPRVHMIASDAIKRIPVDDRQRRMGDNSAEKEMEYGRNVLNAIYGSGDGTQKRPYLVLRVEDERDLIAALSKEVARQSLIRDGGRAYDLIECTDGTRMWFDITSFFGRR